MLAPVFLVLTSILMLGFLVRLGARSPWDAFNLVTSVLGVGIVLATITEPYALVALVTPVVAARRLCRPLTHVPSWFAEVDANQQA